MEEVTPADLKVHVRDVVLTALVVLVTVVVASVGTAAITDTPTTTNPRPVARITTQQLRELSRLMAQVAADPHSTPRERQIAAQGREVVDAVENGEVRIVPPPGTPTSPPPTTTSTTTTTTPTPRGRIIAPPWPGDPLITLPTILPQG